MGKRTKRRAAALAAAGQAVPGTGAACGAGWGLRPAAPRAPCRAQRPAGGRVLLPSRCEQAATLGCLTTQTWQKCHMLLASALQSAPLPPSFDGFIFFLDQTAAARPRGWGGARSSPLLWCCSKRSSARLPSLPLPSLPTRCRVNPATFLGDAINSQWRSTKAPHRSGAAWHP